MSEEKTELPEDIASLSFEQALSELEEIVAKLESGGVELEASIKIYERGEHLKAHCEALLRQAQSRIEKIALSADGEPVGTSPMDAD